MNNIYTWRQIIPPKLFAVFTIVSLLLSAFPAFVLTAEAGDKIDICHILGEVEILYNQPLSAFNGHSVHGDFIIDSQDALERCEALMPITGSIFGTNHLTWLK